MAVVRIRRGQITIPAELRRAANLKDGDSVSVALKPGGGFDVDPFERAAEHPASDLAYWAARATATARDDGTPFQFLTAEQSLAELDAMVDAC